MPLASEFEDSTVTTAMASMITSTSRVYSGPMALAMNPAHYIHRTKMESVSTGSELLLKRLGAYYTMLA
jgi:hypothetical protein